MDLKTQFENAIVVGIDFDGTLCYGNHYTPDECLSAKPRLDMIEAVNKVSKRKFIVIYTARRYELCEATLRWLDMHQVRYNAISFRKTTVDIYVDDRAISPEALLQWSE